MELSKISTVLMLFYSISSYGYCTQDEIQGAPLISGLQSILNTQSSPACDQKQKFYAQPKLDLDSQLRAHDIVNPKIILMSVEHWNYEEETYPRFIEAMKKIGRTTDCFLLERSVSPEEAIFIENINEGKTVDWASMETNFNIPLLKKLQAQNVKIHPIDTDDYQALEDDDIAWLNARDENFSQEIKRLLASGRCNSPFFPVGGAHLASGVKGRRTLAELLTKEKISTFKAGLLVNGVRSADENVTPGIGPHWIWNQKSGIDIDNIASISKSDLLCPSLPSLGSEEIYTISSSLGTAPTFLDSDEFLGHMNDAAFWMVYTCQTSSCRGYNTLIETELREKGISFY